MADKKPVAKSASSSTGAGATASMSSGGSSSFARANVLKDEGNAKYKVGDYAGAVASYNAAIETCPTNSTLYTNRAAAQFMLKAFQSCLDDCEKALELDPDNGKAYQRGGKALLSLGRIDDAISLLQRGALRDPRDEGIRGEYQSATRLQRQMGLAQGYVAGKDWERALGVIGVLTPHMEASYDLHVLRIEALIGARKLDDAHVATTELLTGKKGTSTAAGASADGGSGGKATGGAGASSASSSSSSSSASTSAAAASRGGADPTVLALRARVLNLQGNPAGAIKHLQEALRIEPDHAAAGKMLRALRKQETTKAAGNDCFKAGKWQEAVDAYTECLALDPSGGTDNPGFASKIYCNRAAAYMKLGKPHTAIDDCTRCIDLDDTFAKAYIRRAQACISVGDLERLETAVRDFTRAKTLVGGEGGATSAENRDLLKELDKDLRDAKTKLKAAKRKDYYKILDVSKDATEDDIRKAYLKLARRYHPDKNTTADDEEKKKAEAMFKDISEANGVLTDPTKRRQYDAGATFNASGEIDITAEDDDGHGHMHGMRGGGMGGMGGGIPMEVFEMLFSGGGMGAAMGGGGGMPAGVRFSSGGGGGGMPGMGGMPRGGGMPKGRR